ncbi:hypothetical protein F0562_017849 [Nyssa sinensis]|uniref:non-specific serine/threonine protein kinase n=1 Tax=Nyssa sinensis TaxID=561372 RepID=A0A5J4ZJX9_9ASTE|nr:hypothetical protein F0562_017849 [Nyssa sinensis]
MPELEDDSGTLLPAMAANGVVPQENTLLGKYELGKMLGYGAFGKVYHARNVRTGQSVAIKAVSKQTVVKGDLAAQVKREISITRRLRHPHIVRLFEVLATKTKIYCVMELAKRGELFAKVSKGRFSEDLCRRFFQQLISAVGYCHSLGVFHRDLKPENLLLDENWNLKVTDFGLSAVKNQIRPDGLLHTLCGTPAYVAPEIIAKKGYDGAKVDIWSCGVILYVLNAGYLPFNDPNLMAMYRKIYKGEFRCPKWTSPELKRFLSRLLDPNPETRITIDEILNDPWFKKDYQKIKFEEEDFELKSHDDRDEFLNAFDIISFSSSFDLSGFFNKSDFSVEGERFVSAESPERIIERIVEVAKTEEGLTVTRKKDWGAKLEGQNGNFVVVIEIRRLTQKLVVVEIKRREIDDESSREFWKDKLRPLLSALMHQPEGQVTGS